MKGGKGSRVERHKGLKRNFRIISRNEVKGREDREQELFR